MAEQEAITQSGLKIAHCWWGELLQGTKAQLQQIGIAVGMSFPGEVGGPRRWLTCTDPRGLPVKIMGIDAVFFAHIYYPDRDKPKNEAVAVAPGVLLTAMCGHDEFVGTADALVAMGVVKAGQFPGMPGMRKVCVTILADGSVLDGPPTANCDARYQAGARSVMRISKHKFRVAVMVGEAEAAIRRESEWRTVQEFMRKVRALPRPAPLAGTVPAEELVAPIEGAPEPWTPSLAHSVVQQNLADALSWWKDQVTGTGCRYTDDSQHRIDLAFEALRRAVADGNMVQQPKVPRFEGQRVGNVVCWPGRGSVAPIEPSHLMG